MGLDQYAFAKQDKNDSDRMELAYWRKHPNLQGWMENLYREKGGQEEFNCVEVELTLEDLDRLEADVRNAGLPSTQGFFFGNESDDYYAEQDLDFIERAREQINRGRTVVYYSWW